MATKSESVIDEVAQFEQFDQIQDRNQEVIELTAKGGLISVLGLPSQDPTKLVLINS